jgi:hypothetical protein
MEVLTITDWLSAYWVIIAMSIVIALHAHRMNVEKKQKGNVSMVKKLVLAAFIIEIISGFTYLPFAAGWIPVAQPWWADSFGEGIALNTVTILFTVMVGLILVFYLFNFERLFYTPAYAAAAILLYFLLTGHSELFQYYVYIGAISALLFIFIAGIHLRDNYALGLAVFYTIDFIQVVLLAVGLNGNSIAVIVAEFSIYAFGIFYATGAFRPFRATAPREKKTVETTTKAEVQ